MTIKICEIYDSIQGEGADTGYPTVFVRVSGCNLECSWCDTKYAWEGGDDKSVEDVFSIVRGYEIIRVCITGGEPLLQPDVLKLVDMLADEGLLVTIETNGSKIIDGIREDVIISMDLKTPSSGMLGKMKLDNLIGLRALDQLKFVIADERDYRFALNAIERYQPKCEVVLIPKDGLDVKWLAEAAVKDKLDVRVGIQLHKFIWGDRRGV